MRLWANSQRNTEAAISRTVTDSIQIMRIVFRSGRVVEERGQEWIVSQLFGQDTEHLIDHVMTMDMGDGEVNIYTDVDDSRFDGQEVIYSNDAIEANRKR